MTPHQGGYSPLTGLGQIYYRSLSLTISLSLHLSHSIAIAGLSRAHSYLITRAYRRGIRNVRFFFPFQTCFSCQHIFFTIDQCCKQVGNLLTLMRMHTRAQARARPARHCGKHFMFSVVMSYTIHV